MKKIVHEGAVEHTLLLSPSLPPPLYYYSPARTSSPRTSRIRIMYHPLMFGPSRIQIESIAIHLTTCRNYHMHALENFLHK